MAAGIGGSAWAGYVTSPAIVAGRVSAQESARLHHKILEFGDRPVGTTGALVLPNYLRPHVFQGTSTRAAQMAREPIESVSDELAELIIRYESRFGWKCAEPVCISKAQSTLGTIPKGGAISVRSVFTGGEMEACKACDPVLKLLGIAKNVATPKLQ